MKGLYAGVAAAQGHLDYADWGEKEKKELAFDVHALLPQDRPKKPPPRLPGKTPQIVYHTIKGAATPFLEPNGCYYAEVVIEYTGYRSMDFLLADTQLVSSGGVKPADSVWHHYHDYNPKTNRGTMYLMSDDDHGVFHYGGVWQYEQETGFKYGA